jgi:hypothetical protein
VFGFIFSGCGSDCRVNVLGFKASKSKGPKTKDQRPKTKTLYPNFSMANSKSIVSAAIVIFTFAALSFAQTKPTLMKARDASVRLAYQGRTARVDLDNADNVTLGGEGRHVYKVFFTAVKDHNVYFLFQEQGGSPMHNPMGFCGGDSPQTLVWLKTDLQMKVVAAKSEVFASCAYNGGRYQQGRTRVTGNQLRILFEEGRRKYEITYDNRAPQKSFALVEGTE